MVIEPLARLLKKKLDLRAAAFLLATAYGSLDRFDEAAALLQEQANLTPNDPEPQKALGMIYRRAKRYKEARDAFEKAANSPLILWQFSNSSLSWICWTRISMRLGREYGVSSKKIPMRLSPIFWRAKS